MLFIDQYITDKGRNFHFEKLLRVSVKWKFLGFTLVLLLHDQEMKKIFLVEDDPGISDVIEMVLSSENYAVQSFSTVTAFARRDKNVDPDLYLFDVRLPDGSGIDLCNEIKKNSNNTNIPVIIMSAHAHLTNICDTCQPDNFISKPFDIDNLLLIVHKILEKK